mgnify:CR=1 FL=1
MNGIGERADFLIRTEALDQREDAVVRQTGAEQWIQLDGAGHRRENGDIDNAGMRSHGMKTVCTTASGVSEGLRSKPDALT